MLIYVNIGCDWVLGSWILFPLLGDCICEDKPGSHSGFGGHGRGVRKGT